jgi:hypothetical protein
MDKNQIVVDEAMTTAVSRFNIDANESVFLARELEHVKAKTYDIKYPQLKATALIPVSIEAGSGAETITYTQYDSVGMAKIIANYADDLPRADVSGKQFTRKVKSVGNSYGYSIQDLRASMMSGKSLDSRKAESARRAHDTEINRIAFFGDEKFGLYGILNHPNVPSYILPSDGAGSSTKLIDKTPDNVLRDLNGMVNQMIKVTKGVETPDTLVVPPDVAAHLRTVPRSATSDTTIAEFFLKNNEYVKSIESAVELSGAGAGGKDVLFLYRKDENALTLEIPQPFEQFAPQADNLEFVVNCHSRIGGVIIYYPLSVLKAEGI